MPADTPSPSHPEPERKDLYTKAREVHRECDNVPVMVTRLLVSMAEEIGYLRQEVERLRRSGP